jgi:ketosteroid isomerase-like protein
MNPEEKKRLVCQTLKALIEERDAASATAGFADYVSWWQPGEPPNYGSPGPYTPTWIEKHKFIGDFIERSAQYARAGKSDIHGAHCDGDLVIVEMTNRATFLNGKLYENEYCFLCELKDDRISSIRLYVDTHKAIEAMGGH